MKKVSDLARSWILPVLFALTITTPSWGQVPTFQEVTGHDFGERITVHHQMVRYLETLAETSPRVKLERLGHSWERRELLLAVVSSPENLARLDEIRDVARKIDDPRGLEDADLASALANQPVIVHFGGSIHGFELSGSEGALKLLELLTTSDSRDVLAVLGAAVVLIDPMINPDGRDAFANENHARIGRWANPSALDWNNAYDFWDALRYRTTHYFFDANRDWFAHTQPETRHRVAAYQRWHPQVAVDMHEMGTDLEFYFDPPAPPYGSHTSQFSRDWYERFGDAHAAAFEEKGFEYFARERYNYFYPGYSEAYANLQGAVGMLYEQGSTRGLAGTRSDGTVRTLAQAAEQQFTAAWAATRFAANERLALIEGALASSREALADGNEGITHYFLEGGDPLHLGEVKALLERGGVEVGRLGADLTLSRARGRAGGWSDDHVVPAGSYVVAASQPRNRLVRALLEPHTPMEEHFLESARAAFERAENPRFYDISAWSLPLLFNLGASSAELDGASLRRLEEQLAGPATEPVPTSEASQPRYAYALSGEATATIAAAHRLRSSGLRVNVLRRTTELMGGTTVPAGSATIRVTSPDVHARVHEVADHFGLEVLTIDRGWSPSGNVLGSGDLNVALGDTSVGLLAGSPVAGYSFGWAWHKLDQQYEIPTTLVPTDRLGSSDLSEIDVLVMPDLGSPPELVRRLGEDGDARLTQWLEDGGTIVAIGSSLDSLEQLGLLDIRSYYDHENCDDEGDDADCASEQERSVRVPGAIFEASVDTQHWLATGYTADSLPMFVNSSRLDREPTGPVNARYQTVVKIVDDGTMLSGFAFEESLERVGGTVIASVHEVGRGKIVAFAEDLNFRGFWRGVDRLFLNAIVLGPTAN